MNADGLQSLSQEPEIGRYGPRNVQPTRLATGLLVFLRVLLVIVLLIGGLAGMREVQELHALRTSGQVVQGQVVGIRIKKGKSKSHYVDYNYSLGGKTFEDSEKVRSETYDATHSGDAVTVTALPSKPEVHRYGYVDEERESGAKANWFIGTMLVGLTLELIAYCIRKTTNNQVVMLRDFVAAQARVTEVGKSSGGKAPTRPITFVYRSPFGGEVTRTESVSDQYSGKFTPDQLFTILIDPNGGNRSALLPLISMAELKK